MSKESNEYAMQPLEQLRPRLAQLVQSLSKLEESIRALPLPQVDGEIEHNRSLMTSIQNQTAVIVQQLSSLSKVLHEWGPVLENIIVYPNSEFDLVNNGALLLTLLRKKLTPEVVQWIEQADTLAKQNDALEPAELLQKEEDLTNEIIEYIHEAINNFTFHGYLTTDELDRGLKVSDVIQLKSTPPPEQHDQSSPPSEMNHNDILRFIHQGISSNGDH